MKTVTALLITFIVLGFAVGLVDAQTIQPQLEWSKTYSSQISTLDIVQTQDGGYAITSCTIDGGHDDISISFFLEKTYQNGQRQWQIMVGDKISAPFAYVSIKQTKDSGYILSVPVNKLLKFDPQGKIEWVQNVTGGTVIQTDDGGFLVAGTTCYSYLDVTGQITKIDSNGSITWVKTYRTACNVELGNVVNTPDGGYAYVGDIGTDFWLGKVDANGNQLINQSYPNSNPSDNYLKSLNDLTTTKDGGYAVCGGYNGYNSTVFKVDSQGNMQWRNTYLVPYLQHIIQTSDGHIVAAGNNTLVITTANGQNQGVYKYNMSIFKMSVLDDGLLLFGRQNGNLIISKYTLQPVPEATPQPTIQEVTPQPTTQEATPHPTIPELNMWIIIVLVGVTSAIAISYKKLS